MRIKFIYIACIIPIVSLLAVMYSFTEPVKNSTLKITFINTANGKPIVLRDSLYITPFGETYKITKLRYYISNIVLTGNFPLEENDNYQLVDQSKSTSFIIPVKKGNYNNIHFLLGVDSIHNCSGAQSGALDPMNDMFWTWNSGYVMFKLEGSSPASSSNNNRIEHHIGGYRFGNNVATEISLDLPSLTISENETAEIYIEMNLDKYWSGINDIRIGETPVCTLPGKLAKSIAANFNGIFSVKKMN